MRGSFEPVAGWYDERAGDRGDFWHRHLILPAVLAALGDVAGLAVFGIGCGNGGLSRLLARRGATVTGVDVAPPLVARAREREVPQPLGVTSLTADAADLPRLPAGRTYQLWFARPGLVPQSGGVFVVNARGEALAPVVLPGPLDTFTITSVTEEPAGGSPSPTGPHLLDGDL